MSAWLGVIADDQLARRVYTGPNILGGGLHSGCLAVLDKILPVMRGREDAGRRVFSPASG